MIFVDDRSEADVEFAINLGGEIGELILKSDLSSVSARGRVTIQVIDAALNAVARYTGTARTLSVVPPTLGIKGAYRSGITNVLRLFRLWESLEINGLAVLREKPDSLLGPTPVDLFNPVVQMSLALESETLWPNPNLRVGRVSKSRQRRALSDLLPKLTTVKLVERGVAARGFAALLVDSIRFRFNNLVNGNPTRIHFTVHSGNGYQIHVYETWRYSPVVFGATKSSPVIGPLHVGYYKFEGLKKGVLTKDGGTYVVSAHNTAATLGAF